MPGRHSRVDKVRQEFLRDIVSSGIPVGTVMPCTQEIARKYNISYVTARRVASSLIDDGVLAREPNRMAKLASIPDLQETDRAASLRETCNVFVCTHTEVIRYPDGYVAGVFRALESLLPAHGMMLMHRMIREYVDVPSLVREEVRATKVDGIISCCIHKEDELELFAKTGLPVVSIDHTPKNCRVDSVITNGFAVVQSAVGRLLELGHKRIDFFGHFHNRPIADLDAEEMESHWRRTLEYAGASGRSCFVDEESLPEAIERMLGRTDAPTALFVSNPGIAASVLKKLKSMKVDVPGEFSLIAQGGWSSKDFRISSVDINWYEIARLAAGRMNDLIREKCPMGARLTHAGKLMERGTTAPAR